MTSSIIDVTKEIVHVGPQDRKFRLVEKIGSGSFGEVYLAVIEGTQSTVAVKLEVLNAKNPQLVHESRIYQALNVRITYQTNN